MSLLRNIIENYFKVVIQKRDCPVHIGPCKCKKKLKKVKLRLT